MEPLPPCLSCHQLQERIRRLDAELKRVRATSEHNRIQAEKATRNLSYMLGGPGEAPDSVLDDDEPEPEEAYHLAPRKHMIPLVRE